MVARNDATILASGNYLQYNASASPSYIASGSYTCRAVCMHSKCVRARIYVCEVSAFLPSLFYDYNNARIVTCPTLHTRPRAPCRAAPSPPPCTPDVCECAWRVYAHVCLTYLLGQYIVQVSQKASDRLPSMTSSPLAPHFLG